MFNNLTFFLIHNPLFLRCYSYVYASFKKLESQIVEKHLRERRRPSETNPIYSGATVWALLRTFFAMDGLLFLSKQMIRGTVDVTTRGVTLDDRCSFLH